MADQPRLESQELPAPLSDVHRWRAAPPHTVPASRQTLASHRAAADADGGWRDPTATSVESAGAEKSFGQFMGEAGLRIEDMTADDLRSLLVRGRERFGIHCVPCHDATGSGNGMAARRGMTHPPSYHTTSLRSKPIEAIFAIATHGRGAMPPYRELVSEPDRWAIAAYVRTLQFSQFAPREQLSPADRRALDASKASPTPDAEVTE